jgi:hypothetical protein
MRNMGYAWQYLRVWKTVLLIKKQDFRDIELNGYALGTMMKMWAQDLKSLISSLSATKYVRSLGKLFG